MKRIAVLLADGFEEIEALAPVDVFRRAGFDCQLIGLEALEVRGSHDIRVLADQVFSGDLSGYDLIVLPGGMPGSTNLRDHEGLIAALQKANQDEHLVAAICAAPIVLERAGLLDGKRYTAYPGKEQEIQAGIHSTETVVVDGRIVTSRGAGTSLDFAYRLVDLLGGDGSALAKAMVHRENQ
ncbi:DJ-1/PfpI family protein [Streptococcus suis]|nr:DJ-1/PfpI family protein [Streptococcus suis]